MSLDDANDAEAAELRARVEILTIERDVARKAMSASEARVAEMHAALTQERAARAEMAKTLDHVRSYIAAVTAERYRLVDLVCSFEGVQSYLDEAACLSALPAVDGSGLPVVRA